MSTQSLQPGHRPVHYENGIEPIGSDTGLETTYDGAGIELVNYEAGIESITHHHGLELHAPVALQPQPVPPGLLLHPGNHVAELHNQPRFLQAIDAPQQPSREPYLAYQPFEKPATPIPIASTSKSKKTIYGLNRLAFGIAAVIVFVLVAGAVGGGVAAGVLAKEKKNSEASRSAPAFVVTVGTQPITITASTSSALFSNLSGSPANSDQKVTFAVTVGTSLTTVTMPETSFVSSLGPSASSPRSDSVSATTTPPPSRASPTLFSDSPTSSRAAATSTNSAPSCVSIDNTVYIPTDEVTEWTRYCNIKFAHLSGDMADKTNTLTMEKCIDNCAGRNGAQVPVTCFAISWRYQGTGTDPNCFIFWDTNGNVTATASDNTESARMLGF